MNEEDFGHLVRQYSRLIRSAVARIAGPSAAGICDDVEQNVLIALWQAMPGEQIPDHPSSYIYRAAVRETIRAVRGLKQTSELGPDADKADLSVSQDVIVEGKELGRAIRTTLSEIGPDRRRAVTAHLAGYDVKEIMAMFEWPYHKARNLIARGMADLRRKLDARGCRD
ncbi:MAG: RNA polymerase sigma factor [Acidobacteriota bacterium]